MIQLEVTGHLLYHTLLVEAVMSPHLGSRAKGPASFLDHLKHTNLCKELHNVLVAPENNAYHASWKIRIKFTSNKMTSASLKKETHKTGFFERKQKSFWLEQLPQIYFQSRAYLQRQTTKQILIDFSLTQQSNGIPIPFSFPDHLRIYMLKRHRL